MCSPLEVEDERKLAEFLEDLRGDNPSIHDDFELTARETRAFLRARGIRYGGTVEGWFDYECPDYRLVFFTLEMKGLDTEESDKLADELFTRLVEKSPTFIHSITIDTL